MDFVTFANVTNNQTVMILKELTKTRPQEIIIICLLVISISIGIAILINQKKIKKQLQQLLDQKKDEP